MWIDSDAAVGVTGFLVEREHYTRGWRRLELQLNPPYTNESRRPRLRGWCGSTNDVSVTAQGMVRVVRLNAAGTRALVEALSGPELSAALEAAGWPELAP